MQAISLDAFLRHHVRSYDAWPEPLHYILRRSVWISLLTELVVLGFFILVQPFSLFVLERTSRQESFWIAGGDILNNIIGLAWTLLPYLALINLANLFLTLVVLTLTLFTLEGARSGIHSLAAVQVLPSTFSMLSGFFLLGVFGIAVVVNIVIWIVLIIVGIAIIGAVLGAIANS